MTTSVVVLGFLGARMAGRAPWQGALTGLVLAIQPFLMVPLGLLVATRRFFARPASLGYSERADVARLLFVAVSGGLDLSQALELVAGLAPEARNEIVQVTRSAKREGLAAALYRSDGAMAPLFRMLARAQMAGSPVLASLDAYIREQTLHAKTESLSRVRRLPVLLTVPLVTMLLPGAVLLGLAPTAIETGLDVLAPLLGG